jgi:hypothetical protein
LLQPTCIGWPAAVSKLTLLSRVGVHDRVNISKPRKLAEVDFTDAS